MTPTGLELRGGTLSTETVGRSNRKPKDRGYHAFQETAPTAGFQSILFGEGQNHLIAGSQVAPDYFSDLNLDHIVDSIVAGREEYGLKSFLHLPLTSIAEIHYRQAVFHDLEVPSLFDSLQSFAGAMREMRSCIAQSEKFYYKYQKHALFLNTVEIYYFAVSCLTCDLSSARLESRGFQTLREYLTGYTDSREFRALAEETRQLRSDLNSIQYSVHIDGRHVTVGKFDGEPDFSAEVLRIFEKFRQGGSKEYQFRISSWPEMNHVEAAIMDRVARLYPETFSRLEQYPERHRGYLDYVLAALDREVQFYLAYIEFRRRIEKTGPPFCYPDVTASKEIHADNTFDLALANKLVEARRPVVTNSFFLKGPERIVVVSGPNQGGKTTFARTFGQLHHLGCLGCPIPGTDAKLFLFDKLFTHFERQEDLQNLRGKLEDELKRIHSILEQATDQSILIMNESFLSTTLNDALFLSKQIMQRIVQLDMLCVTVTFLDELTTLSDSTVSMVGTVDPKNPTLRTLKIVRRPADGRAYAAAIAQKHRLTQNAITERIAANADRDGRS
jgi:DNA mismatch repair protein MutS